MLKQDTINAFAVFAGVTPEDLLAKIKSEQEEDISLRDVKVFTPDELETRIKNEKSTSYKEGKEAGIEIPIKDKKKELGYEFEGKDLDSFLNFHTNKIKAGFEKPNEKITELENDIKTLNTAHATALETESNKNLALSNRLNNMVITGEIMAVIPENTVIPKADIATLFNSNFEIVKEDGKTIIKQNGETLKDATTAAPKGLKEVFMDFATERKYISSTGGRGGGNEGGSGGSNAKSISQFQSEMEKQGINVNSQEYSKKYAEWRKDNKEVTA